MKRAGEPYPVGTKLYATYWGKDGKIHYDKPCVVAKCLLNTDVTGMYLITFIDGTSTRILSNQLSTTKQELKFDEQGNIR